MNREMRAASGFSLLIFGPLLIAFVLPALFIIPSGLLMILISALDPTVPIIESLKYNAWACGPVIMIVTLFFGGIALYRLYAQGFSRPVVWFLIWSALSIGLFLAAWLGATILTSIGASDYAPGEFLRWTATAAVVLTLLCQPFVGLWIFISLRLFDSFGPKEGI